MSFPRESIRGKAFLVAQLGIDFFVCMGVRYYINSCFRYCNML